MKFEIINILHHIRELYSLPKSKARFDKYLFMLQGESKDELIIPIAGFNPMGGERAKDKLEELISLGAEDIAQEELTKINETLSTVDDHHKIMVGLNLVDDVDGSWSTYSTTDYASKFEFDSLLKRHFCTPFFWTSEVIVEETIIQRTRDYVYRTLYWMTQGKPNTIAELMQQEIVVQKQSRLNSTNNDDVHEFDNTQFSDFEKIYIEHVDSTEYSLKFNLFYGDKASQELNYPYYGIADKNGFDYAQHMSRLNEL